MEQVGDDRTWQSAGFGRVTDGLPYGASGPCAPSRLSYLVYGNVDHKRCEFVRERLADVSLGRLPDLDKYLDGNGQRRAVTDSDRERTPRGPSTAPPPRIASYAAACPSAADQWLDSERSGAS